MLGVGYRDSVVAKMGSKVRKIGPLRAKGGPTSPPAGDRATPNGDAVASLHRIDSGYFSVAWLMIVGSKVNGVEPFVTLIAYL